MEERKIIVPRIPVSTYRLQFNHLFRFSDAEGLIAYLHELGITDIYSSPFFKARKGSLHGYDIVDPSMLNPEIGTDEEYAAFIQTLKKYGMGQIADIVPNHMCCDSDNPWWMDVLENGLSSPHERFFDIDWSPAIEQLSGKLLIPLLGDQYGSVLENRELTLSFEDGAFFVAYQALKLPVAPDTYNLILEHRLEDLRRLLPGEDPGLTELLSIITALQHLPPAVAREDEKIAERYREKEIIKKRLSALYGNSPGIRDFIDGNVAIFNGKKGDPASFDLLDRLLAGQIWRLSYWRVAMEEINYRRFFDINHTSAIHVEDPTVFRETHSLALRLVGEGKVTGLRVDHPDGLYNPPGYFDALQRACLAGLTSEINPDVDAEETVHEPEETKICETPPESPPAERIFYIVGEKILTKGEKLPEEWRIFGTTGYSFLASVNGIFVDTGNARMFDSIYARFIGTGMNFADVVYDNKKLVIHVSMSSEINTLGHYLNKISEKNRHTRDFTLYSLTKVITEVIAFFPVYRTYITACTVKDKDRQYIEAAIAKAKRKNPAISSSIFDFLGDVLLLRFPDSLSEEDRKEWLDFVMRFQQMTSPVMAKGFEDTAFYIYNRLVSLNEVGGYPERFGLSPESFHRQNLERLKYWPHALTATSTHDTKRSEDVRARINVLSEIPGEWRKYLTKWGNLNKKRKIAVEGQEAPDRNEEYFLYQTLIGAWPSGLPGDSEYSEFRERMSSYMIKALREAKINSSWINPNTAYENAVTSFIHDILSATGHNRFLEEFRVFQKSVAYFGMLNSLAQVLLKITSPGVPDFYQGTEMWDFSLVDPDNRRPVNFELRIKTLAALKEKLSKSGQDYTALLGELLDNWEDGAIKFYVTRQALLFRNENRELFMEGTYIPLAGHGEQADNFCGFARLQGGKTALTIVPRLMTRILNFKAEAPLKEKIWSDNIVVLPEEISVDAFTNVLTGKRIAAVRHEDKKALYLRDVFSVFPVALLANR